ncbi:MAG: hypothetical protein P8O93_04905 [Flavobacteriaceae bacterium]|nr:hypothetical protein [Flavobacteriaceae bacterium]MDG1962173.1 hypothetical protein [Flavobacteriaceae bacterium]
MFQKIIRHKGFWSSVVGLGLSFGLLFLLIQWLRFDYSFVFMADPLRFVLGWIGGSFAYGFFVSYGKFFRVIQRNKAG